MMSSQAYLEGANPYPPEAIKKYTEKGWWLNLTYGDVLDRSVGRDPNQIAVIDHHVRLTYAQLREQIDRFAIGLLKLGIKKNDRLLIQLPNRYEFLVAYFGLHRIGAVPMLGISRYDYREVIHFFQVMEPVGWIVAMKEGEREFLPLITRIRAEAKSLRHLIIIDDGESAQPGSLSMADLIGDVDLADYPGGLSDSISSGPQRRGSDLAHGRYNRSAERGPPHT